MQDLKTTVAQQQKQIEAYGGRAESERTARPSESVPGGLEVKTPRGTRC